MGTFNTPLSIKVGSNAYELIMFRELYEICRHDLTFYDGLLAAAADPGAYLAEKHYVLPAKCLDTLKLLLTTPSKTNFIRPCLVARLSWCQAKDKDRIVEVPKAGVEYCHWDDCPGPPQ